MNKLKTIQKENQRLNLIDKYNWKEIFHHIIKIGKDLSQTINNSKYNLTRGSQVILLMITDGEKWHCLAAKSLSAQFRGITGNNNGDFYCLNCFQ